MVYFVGVLVSLIVQGLKKRYQTTGWTNLLFVAILALLGAAAYTFLVDFGYWDAVVKVLMTAGSFYAFILKQLPDSVQQ